jgi:hypothetical protein
MHLSGWEKDKRKKIKGKRKKYEKAGCGETITNNE